MDRTSDALAGTPDRLQPGSALPLVPRYYSPYYSPHDCSRSSRIRPENKHSALVKLVEAPRIEHVDKHLGRQRFGSVEGGSEGGNGLIGIAPQQSTIGSDRVSPVRG
jgi:hypothetical protein